MYIFVLDIVKKCCSMVWCWHMFEDGVAQAIKIIFDFQVYIPTRWSCHINDISCSMCRYLCIYLQCYLATYYYVSNTLHSFYCCTIFHDVRLLYCWDDDLHDVMMVYKLFLLFYLLVNPRIWGELYAVRSEQGMATLPQHKEHYHEEIRRTIQGPLPRDLRGVSSYFSVV